MTNREIALISAKVEATNFAKKVARKKFRMGLLQHLDNMVGYKAFKADGTLSVVADRKLAKNGLGTRVIDTYFNDVCSTRMTTALRVYGRRIWLVVRLYKYDSKKWRESVINVEYKIQIGMVEPVGKKHIEEIYDIWDIEDITTENASSVITKMNRLRALEKEQIELKNEIESATLGY